MLFLLILCSCSPLGPFVPAPPGITMRFLIEGPGPSHCDFERSFVDDNNRWPRDRNRPTPGPRLGGGLSDFPSMMIPPHGSHYDPRGIQRCTPKVSTLHISTRGYSMGRYKSGMKSMTWRICANSGTTFLPSEVSIELTVVL